MNGRPKLVYHLTPDQETAIEDYYFRKAEVKNLRELAKRLKVSTPTGASLISLRVLAQWAEEGRIIISPTYNSPAAIPRSRRSG